MVGAADFDSNGILTLVVDTPSSLIPADGDSTTFVLATCNPCSGEPLFELAFTSATAEDDCAYGAFNNNEVIVTETQVWLSTHPSPTFTS